MGDATLERTVPDSVADDTVTVAGLAVRLLRKGQGPPFVVLHDSLGNLGWLPFYEQLAARSPSTCPTCPGTASPSRPEWARSPRDLAILAPSLLDEVAVWRASRWSGWVSAGSSPPRWRP